MSEGVLSCYPCFIKYSENLSNWNIHKYYIVTTKILSLLLEGWLIT